MGSISPIVGGGEGHRKVTRFMGDDDRQRVMDFLTRVDNFFWPPLSSQHRQGSLEKYFDYMLGDGKGKIIIHEEQGEVTGLWAYRFEGENDQTIYLCNAAVKNPRYSGRTLYGLAKAMADAERGKPLETVWATTWEENTDIGGVLEKLGLKHTETKKEDYVGTRTTHIYRGKWADLVKYFSRMERDRPSKDSLPQPKDLP